MSLLDKASLLVTPNAVKTGKLYSVIPNDGTGDLDVLRNTTATRVNSLGLIENVALNLPRIDYTGLEYPSILIEPQRTNRLLNSETVVNQSITTTNVPITLSFYGTGTINLSGSFAGSLVGTGVNNRVNLTFTPTSGTLNISVVNSVKKGQLEQGSYLTSYIPTLVSAVTRNTDIITKNNIFTNGFVTNSGGTLFLDLENNISLSRDIASQGINISDSSTQFNGNAFEIRSIASGRLTIAKRVSGSLTILAPTNTNRIKIAISWNGTNSNLYLNGIKIVTNTSFTATALNFLTLGGGEDVSKSIVAAALFPNPLTDLECIKLTTI